MVDVVRAETAAVRRLSTADRTAVSRFRTSLLLTAVAGLAWPVALSIFASIRGSITHPPVGHGKYRYSRVVTGWPDFTAPWPIPAVVLATLIVVTVLLLRRQRLIPHMLGALAFTWLCVGGGVTFVGFMYFGAEHWPTWQIWLGIPAVIAGGVLWLLNRRRENQLLGDRRRR
ncbi:hypothetical protein ACWGJ9_09680 [Curtobacterium citreum]